jgi:indolepyruvate ferredoxin oxidoreductase alpha subunit
MHEILVDEPGKKMLLLGNHAIARAAVEAGISVASTYPGTPSSEIGNLMSEIAKDAGIYFEFSSNEKVAFETAGAAAVAGVRAFSFMKHVGLNVAADAFMTLAYTGVRAGYVVLSADDPSCHSSQNEQDNRYYARMSGVPMVEPSSPDEARRMMHYAFEISEKFEEPVLFRTTTRMNHVRGIVELGEIRKPHDGRVHFEKDSQRFVTVPANARVRHIKLLEKIPRMRSESEVSPFNRVMVPERENIGGEKKLGIITSGVSFNYVMETLENVDFGVEARVLKLGMTNPLPDDMLEEFCREEDTVVIIEELEPYLEEYVKALMKERDVDVEIIGKREGHFPRNFEFNPDIVANGIRSVLEGEGIETPELKAERFRWKDIITPPRPPQLCPGCPHRGTYFAVKRATKGKAVYPTDIGCYTLGILPPHSSGDLLICMGSSAGSAGGLSRVVDEPVIAFIGDSTFFHSGIPALVNAIHNGHRFVLNIMDNATTAMTGHQPHPGLPRGSMGGQAKPVSIEKVCRGIGVEFVKVVNPLNIKETQKAFEEALQQDGVSVVITRSPCALLLDRELRKRGRSRTKYTVDQEKCTQCDVCTKTFACPAFYKEGDAHFIDAGLCLGCGVCEQVCPFGAMIPLDGGD